MSERAPEAARDAWETSAPAMLKMLGRALGATRGAVMRKLPGERAVVRVSWRRSPDVVTWPRTVVLGGSVRASLAAGRHVRLPRVRRDGVAESVLLVPVRSPDAWWGVIGFAADGARGWTAAQAAAVHATSRMLAAAIHASRRDAEWQATNELLRREHETGLRHITDQLQDDVMQLLSATHAQLEVVRGRAAGDPALLEAVEQSGWSLRLGLSRIRELAGAGEAANPWVPAR